MSVAHLRDVVGDVCRDASAPQSLDNINGSGHRRVSNWDH